MTKQTKVPELGQRVATILAEQRLRALAERRAEASKQILKERLLCLAMGIAFGLFAILVEKALGILFNIPWL